MPQRTLNSLKTQIDTPEKLLVTATEYILENTCLGKLITFGQAFFHSRLLSVDGTHEMIF